MARTRHRRRRHRNPSRNQWIAIGVSTAVVVTGGTILVVRHRRQKALTGTTGGATTGTTQGTGSPTGGSGNRLYHRELDVLCRQPGNLTLADRITLTNGLYVPTLNRELAKLPPQLTPNQANNVVSSVANAVLRQTCQPVSHETMQMSLLLAHDAWLKTSGQG